MLSANVVWHSPPEKPSLSDDAIHVWRIRLQQPPAVARHLWQYLSADEQERAARFRFDVHRRRFVVGRGAMRQILGAYLAVEPGQVCFTYGEHGKPELSPQQTREGLAFNLTHSEDLALCALAQGRRVGVDVERVRVIEDALSIAQNYFSPAEIAVLNGCTGADLWQVFLQCWALKEAILKGSGKGLTVPLNSIDVSPHLNGSPRLLPIADGPTLWTVTSFRLEQPDAVAAVALNGDGWKVVHWEWGGLHPSSLIYM